MTVEACQQTSKAASNPGCQIAQSFPWLIHLKRIGPPLNHQRGTSQLSLIFVFLMNKNRFRRVFSKRLGMLVAVAEDVVSQGKTPGEGAASGAASDEGALGVVSAMTAFAVAILATQPGVSFAQALPTGGQVTAGQASISQGSNTMWSALRNELAANSAASHR
jgi:hypothetical protein